MESVLEKWFPLQGERAHSLNFLNSQIKSKSNQIHFLLFFLPLSPWSCVVATIFSSLAFHFSSISMANLSHLVATIFSSLAFFPSSVFMAKLSCLVAASFSSLVLLFSSVSTANLMCLLVTTFSSLSFLSNLFSLPHFNLLRVARRCFSWSSVSDDLFFSSCNFLVTGIYIFHVLSSAFLSSVLQSLFALSFPFLSERFIFVHAKKQL